MEDEKSPLDIHRLKFKPQLPNLLMHFPALEIIEGEPEVAMPQAEKIKKHFPKTFGSPILRFSPGKNPEFVSPLKVGVVLSGGQAPGGHNVIAGLFDALKKLHYKSRLFGFLDGPKGLVENQYKELTDLMLGEFRNTGGFDLLGSGRTKIETNEQLAAVLKNCEALALDGLVIIGGDDSNTNAAVLAEYFAQLVSQVEFVLNRGVLLR
jgi:pyrophosphate--fructose-6-phosphate 1-phosphotransferase